MMLFLGVLQVGLALHARNVLVAAAQEGARFSANADRSPEEGAARTRDAIAGSLGTELAAAMHVVPLPPAGDPLVVGIRVTGPLPSVFGLVGPVSITVEGHALEEQR